MRLAALILRFMKKFVGICLLLVSSVSSGLAGDQENELRNSLSGFIQAFDNLDRDRFADYFADSATLFQPRRFGSRAENKEEILSQFREIFETIRGKQTQPPYMEIQPRNLRIQMLADRVAIVTFHLDDRPGVLGRRTMIWEREKNGWKIVHIHASEVTIEK
jgi:ketosteroid isomerase-like protein